MADLQVPPAVGTSGQRLDTIVINAGSTIYRQTIVIGDPTSSSALANVGSDGRLWIVSASSGAVQVLTSGTYIVTGTVSLSSGTVTLSSNPTVISASSGVVQVLTSGTLIVAMTSGTVTLSSATSLSSGTVTLSSNPTVISASSGNVGTFPSTSNLDSVFVFNASSSNSLTNISTAALILRGWNLGNQTTSAAASVKCYNSTTATAGSTSNLLVTIPIPGGSAGAGNNFVLGQGVSFTGGLTIMVTGNFAATSTGTTHSAGDVVGTFYYV